MLLTAKLKVRPELLKFRRFNTPQFCCGKLGVWGICSPTYAKISKRNLKYPGALLRGFFIFL
jgi:hypothetical protein